MHGQQNINIFHASKDGTRQYGLFIALGRDNQTLRKLKDFSNHWKRVDLLMDHLTNLSVVSQLMAKLRFGQSGCRGRNHSVFRMVLRVSDFSPSNGDSFQEAS